MLSLSLSTHFSVHFTFPFLFLSFLFLFLILIIIIIIIIIWINGSYCLIQIRFYPEKFYFFSVQFISNKLSSSHFLTSEIFVKISSLKLLATYYPENCKIFRLSQNLTKLLRVIRFCKTNLTAQSILSSEI